MKATLIFVALASLTTSAMAQPAGTIMGMTCDQARQLVASQGAVVLHTSPTTYDRYVRSGSFCAFHETAHPAWVRTADVAQCSVGGICRSIEIDNGR